MSAAYIKSMSLDRSKLVNYPNSSNSISNVNNSANNNSTSCIGFAHDSAGPGVSQLHSQSLYNLPGSRRSCTEAPFHQPPPPPYDKVSSKDDSSLLPSKDRRALPEHQTSSAFRAPAPPNHFEPVQRERSGIYESITERTEPENSASSSSDPESVPLPKPRVKRFDHINVSPMDNSYRDYLKDHVSLNFSGSRAHSVEQQPFNSRDSGILDDRSPSLGNSIEGSIATTDGTNNGFKTRSQAVATDCNNIHSKRDILLSNAVDDKLKSQHTSKDMSMNESTKPKKKVPLPSQFCSKENSQGEFVVRKRSRGQRDRLRQIRQANRRYTVQGLEHSASGLYDENMSDFSDSSRTEVSEDLLSVFKSMTKEELLQVLLTSKAQMIRKDQYIRDLENYIDDLLVRVMENTPRLLSRQTLHRLR